MEALITAAESLLGVSLTPDQVAAFEHYGEELTAWNEKSNLTTIIDPRGILIKHFLDSLSCLLALQAAPQPARPVRLVDVGTGAGFPGLPLKIVCPSLQVTLVESVAKKCEFVRHMIRELDLQGTTVLQQRAEELGRDPQHRDRYDWALARAVARLPVLLELLLPLVRVGGRCLAQKGEAAPLETQGATRALAVLGGAVRQLLPVELPGVVETRYLVIVEKVAATPAEYPRRPGIPNKRPL